MIYSIKFGERVSTLRKERGLTGEKFAELLFVSPQAVSKWENGKNLPESALLPAISKLLGVSIDSLFAPEVFSVKPHLGGHYIDEIPMLSWGANARLHMGKCYKDLVRCNRNRHILY